MYRREKYLGLDRAAIFEEYYSNNETQATFAARLNLTESEFHGIIESERKKRGLVVHKESTINGKDWVLLGQTEAKEQLPVMQVEQTGCLQQELVVSNNKVVEPFNMSVEYYGSTIRVGGEKELAALLRCMKNA